MGRQRFAFSLVVAQLALVTMFVSPTVAVAQAVDDFVFSSVEVDFYFERDDSDRATVRVTERFTAEFPEFDQNKGISRSVPRFYDRRPVLVDGVSVTRNGEAEPIDSESADGSEWVVETGTDEYVRGTQVYEFSYSLRDVVDDVDGRQEFFWDAVPADSIQPFGNVVARVHLDDDVKDSFTGDVRCLQGSSAATRDCASDVDGGLLTFESNGELDAGEGLSVVAGFEGDSFAPYTEGPAGVVATSVMALAAAVGAGAMAWMVRIYSTVGRNAPRRGELTATFIAPSGMSILKAAAIKCATLGGNAVPAQIVDLAIRGNIRIVETASNSRWSQSENYSIELVHPDGVDEDERALLDAFFPSGTAGEQYSFSDPDDDTSEALQELTNSINKSVVEDGYRRTVPVNKAAIALGSVAIVAAIGSGLFFIGRPADWRISLVIVGAMLGLFAMVSTMGIRPLTEKGREVVDRLDGIKLYLKSATSNRKSEFEPNSFTDGDRYQTVAAYEQTLPYSILFGFGKKWAEKLSHQYEGNTGPMWFTGIQPFSPVHFSAALNNFASSPSGAAGASSGGFAGGASVGGGGGGGSVGGR
ncbi:DUF2207 domain-containing protein [Hoyosella rhizosphaerae]|uniref:DUF2207 domain-containing protein n=1 Tax=Hoyosella rhizosphaerae TaxID=1755582 RepID=A0A916TZC8_9ACTN|nr:DUF2207 domain-containing protein [Hoyosella rhizosphaerae]MBN4927098.1 DUF2207 domain-containing protein [Hoyosella rhizosphaerae]GGC54061.1 hypothetical protein GCM10011410_02980 [Hoyosella rhizosphaerae]